MADIKTETKQPKKNFAKTGYIITVGRRKNAVARVRVYTTPGQNTAWGEQVLKKGDMYVNEKPIAEYFSSAVSKTKYLLPLRITNTLDKYTITIKVAGGGLEGQLDATIHGIARALDKIDKEKFHSTLKKHNLLTRDARARQRRKVGMGGKSRRKKQSPKR